MEKHSDADQHTTTDIHSLDEAIVFAEEEGLFQRLRTLYATIPDGECGGCAACCMESVETHWVEFLQIYAYLRERPEVLRELIPGILRFYLLEGVEKRHCPFRCEGRRCAIYPVRPLPCRLFGQWGEDDYESNYAVTLRENREMAGYYLVNHGVSLPEAVVTYKVPYCRTFRKTADLTQEGFYDLLDGMMAIQSRFLFAGLVDEEITPHGLVTWWMAVWFDLDKVQEKKVLIMQTYPEETHTEKLAELLREAGKFID